MRGTYGRFFFFNIVIIYFFKISYLFPYISITIIHTWIVRESLLHEEGGRSARVTWHVFHG